MHSLYLNIKIHHLIFLTLVAFLGTQRFFIGEIVPFACLLTFALFLYYIFAKGKGDKAFTYLFVSLFLCIDNGGNIYSETTALIRYAVYITTLCYLLINFKLNIIYSLIFSLFLLLLCLITIFLENPINANILRRDILIIILIFIFINQNVNYLDKYRFDESILTAFFSLFLFFEICNIVFFSSFYSNEYLNYNSTKALLIIPSLLLYRRINIIIFFIIFSITLLVLVEYQSRLIFLFTIISFATLFLRNVLNLKYLILLILFLVILYNLSFIVADLIISKKPSQMFLGFISIQSFSEFLLLLKGLDIVRYYEHALFFDRSYFEIFFGSGLGSGLIDVNNYFYFVGEKKSAFSDLEIQSGHFYNFHDFHTDIGLRFGLLPVLIMIIYIYFKIIFSNLQQMGYYAVIFVGLFCMFYSSAGLILIAMLLISRYSTGNDKKINE
tara:strand:+ start:953 stop:2275 length:1323 start_codon:yes stop_codon:yes gene_type:complete